MPWHRILGIFLLDLFSGPAFQVELEKDLSARKQMLDVAVVRLQNGELGSPPNQIPDGLEDLAKHNLLTYKSLHEPLDVWALRELTSHYVNYRKQLTPPEEPMVDECEFRLFGLTTRFPQKLTREIQATGHPRLEQIRPGIYNLNWTAGPLRIIVTSDVEKAERNSLWHLLSGVPELVQYGAEHYHFHRQNNSTIINALYQRYQMEGIDMPYTLEDYYKEFTAENIGLLSSEERLKGLPPEERLKGLPTEERLKGLPPEDVLEQFSREELEEYLKRKDPTDNR